MAIMVDGKFMPCNFIQATLGNIKDKSLKEMRDDLLKSKWFCMEYSYCILGECDEYFKEVVENIRMLISRLTHMRSLIYKRI